MLDQAAANALTLATHVRLRVPSPAFPASLRRRAELRAGLHLAIADFTVGTTCDCNGHGVGCDHSAGGGYGCECGRNTTGENCERCLPLFNASPWAAAGGDGGICARCTCNGHADACVYDSDSTDGVCSCNDNTVRHFPAHFPPC